MDFTVFISGVVLISSLHGMMVQRNNVLKRIEAAAPCGLTDL